jgi:hypothetical protein
LGRLGLELSRVIAERFDGDRRRAGRAGLRRVLRALQVRDFAGWGETEKQAARAMAPILALIPQLGSWSARDRRDLARLVRAKGARSELGFAGRVLRHRRLGPALQALVPGP